MFRELFVNLFLMIVALVSAVVVVSAVLWFHCIGYIELESLCGRHCIALIAQHCVAGTSLRCSDKKYPISENFGCESA